MAGNRDPDRIPRHSMAERTVHWALALAYVLLFLSGVALFEPLLFWLSYLFGGGEVMRVVHPFIGVVLAVLYAWYAIPIWRDNLLTPSDRTWLRRAPQIITRKLEVPVEGKYNAGQKLVFWGMVVIIPVLLVTGIILWRPYFAPSFPISWRRAAVVIHIISAFLMFGIMGIHIYAGYWTKGSIRAMTRGYVSRAWARFHHPRWYSEVEAKKKQGAA